VRRGPRFGDASSATCGTVRKRRVGPIFHPEFAYDWVVPEFPDEGRELLQHLFVGAGRLQSVGREARIRDGFAPADPVLAEPVRFPNAGLCEEPAPTQRRAAVRNSRPSNLCENVLLRHCGYLANKNWTGLYNTATRRMTRKRNPRRLPRSRSTQRFAPRFAPPIWRHSCGPAVQKPPTGRPSSPVNRSLYSSSPPNHERAPRATSVLRNVGPLRHSTLPVRDLDVRPYRRTFPLNVSGSASTTRNSTGTL